MEQTGFKYSQFRKLEYLQKTLLNFISPSGSTVFNRHNPKGVKLLTRLRLGLTHRCEHSSNIVFKKIHLTQSAAVVMILKRHLISFFNVLILEMKDQLS